MGFFQIPVPGKMEVLLCRLVKQARVTRGPVIATASSNTTCSAGCPSESWHSVLINPCALQSRINQKLDYIYVPGVSPPFDDPLVRLIRQIAAYSGNLRSRDRYLGMPRPGPQVYPPPPPK